MRLGRDRRDRQVALHRAQEPFSHLVGAVAAALVAIGKLRLSVLRAGTADHAGGCDARVDDPRAHGGDADPVRTKLVSHRLRQPEHRELGGGVCDQRRVGMKARGRGDVDDVTAAAALHHPRHEQRAAMDDAHQVDRDQPVPVLGSGLEEASDDADARVVDQQIDALEPLVDRVGERAHLLPTGDVGPLREHLGAERLDVARGAVKTGLVDVADDHARAACGTQQRRLAADPRACPGDQRDASVQTLDVHHAPPVG